MTRTRATGSAEILGTFIGKDEVEAALQGSHSDREAMARRIASSSGYNSHMAYVRGDDVGALRRRPAGPSLFSSRRVRRPLNAEQQAASNDPVYQRAYRKMMIENVNFKHLSPAEQQAFNRRRRAYGQPDFEE
jgi:hypothetical protein